MKKVHVVIPDLFLPPQLAAYACADLQLPALQKLLAFAAAAPLHTDSLEAWLCDRFGVEPLAIAPLTLQADGMAPGDACWLRADPVNISMQRDQMIMQGVAVLTADEAAQFCASLNAHFAVDGLHFYAPHPQRWYLQLDKVPEIQTYSVSQVVGADVNSYLPSGSEALRWHSLYNEIQMLFYEHPLNLAREQRGEPVVSAAWLWGGGRPVQELRRPYRRVAGGSELALAFAKAAGIADGAAVEPMLANCLREEGDMLLVHEELRTALQAANISAWRTALQQFEMNYAVPLLAALGRGDIAQLTLYVPGEEGGQFIVKRAALWKLWRLPLSLQNFAKLQKTIRYWY